MVRHLALFNEKPYKACLINGMVLGTDGRKMSKSLGNYIATSEVLDKYGADATRQWAAGGGATGSDIPFRWPDVEYGWRFLIKLWNACRFASLHLRDYVPREGVKLEVLDRWLLSKLERVTMDVTNALENYQFNIATERVRSFTWHVLCDHYIEAVKHRLYNPGKYGEERREAAQYALYTAIYRILQLLAPICPYITEEIYQTIYAKRIGFKSIHVTPWPTPRKDRIDEEAERCGDLIIAVIGGVRKDKSERKLPLNTPIKKLTIYAGSEEDAAALRRGVIDIAGTCKAGEVQILPTVGEGRVVKECPNIRFIAEY